MAGNFLCGGNELSDCYYKESKSEQHQLGPVQFQIAVIITICVIPSFFSELVLLPLQLSVPTADPLAECVFANAFTIVSIGPVDALLITTREAANSNVRERNDCIVLSPVAIQSTTKFRGAQTELWRITAF